MQDFKGLKIRVAGGAQVFGVNLLGGVPVQISSGDAYVAMQRGTIDGYILPLPSITPYNLQELSGAISTNANFAAAANYYAVSKAFFDAQSAETQQMLLDCGKRAEETLATYLTEENERLKRQFAEQGIELFEFSPELWAEIQQAMQPAVDDFISRMERLGLDGQGAYDQYVKALDN